MSEYSDAGEAPAQGPAPAGEQQDAGAPLLDALGYYDDDDQGGYADERQQQIGQQQIAEAQAAQEMAELRSGDRVAETARATAQYQAAIDGLVQQHPAMRTQEAVDAMGPIYDQIAAEYGQDAASDPEVILRIYEQAGGDQAFGPALAEQQYLAPIFDKFAAGRDEIT